TAEMDNKPVWERRVHLGERDRARVEVPWPLEGAKPAEPLGASAPAPPPPPAQRSSLTRTLAYVSGGVGAVGLLTGIVAGSVALAQRSTIKDNCPNNLCNAQGKRAVSTGQGAATVSTFTFPIGLAGLGGAVALFLVSKPPEVKGD